MWLLVSTCTAFARIVFLYLHYSHYTKDFILDFSAKFQVKYDKNIKNDPKNSNKCESLQNKMYKHYVSVVEMDGTMDEMI